MPTLVQNSNIHWTVQHLKAIALAKGYTPMELSHEAGSERNQIQRWEEEGWTPRVDTLEKHLRVLGYRISIVPI